VLKNYEGDNRLLVLTSHLPRKGSEGDRALRAVGPWSVFDAIEIFDDPVDGLDLATGPAPGVQRLRYYGAGGAQEPLPGFWTEDDIEQRYTPTGK